MVFSRKRTLHVRLLLVASCLTACGGESNARDDVRDEVRGVVASAVVSGRPSTAAEDRSVFILTGSPSDPDPLRCSGTLIAPNLVVTARHCLIVQRVGALNCHPSGELIDPNDPRGQDLRTDRPENISVRHGNDSKSFKTVKARKVLTPSEATICKNDVGLVVLEDALADESMAVRVDAPKPGESFSFAGWGKTGDKAPLPEERKALDALKVTEVGPGLLAAGTFATRGATLCFGDSGGGAWFDGDAVGGVYSRIEGSSCELAEGRNVFSMLAPHRALIERAFAEAGHPPWFAGEPKPGSTKSVATCDAGSCAEQAAAPADPAPKPAGCSATAGRRSSWSSFGALALFAIIAISRRRTRR